MIYIKYLFILFLLLLTILYVYINKIKNNYYTILIIFITGCWIFINNIDNHKNQNYCLSFLNKKSEEGQCLIGNNKYYSGLIWNGCIDIWHLYHLLLWILIGLLSPKYLIYVITFSILWESIEHFASIKLCNGNPKKFYGRIEDIFINIIGYIIGCYI